jgi:hypothetical protein
MVSQGDEYHEVMDEGGKMIIWMSDLRGGVERVDM